MMTTIINKELISFRELEKKIYAYVCELAREITQQVLESYDEEIAQTRDKKICRGGKGKRDTSIKIVYREAAYSRNVYRTKTEDGQTAHVFLPDQAMHMDKIGLISTNLAKALYKKENQELAETIDRYTDGLICSIQMQEIIETLSTVKAPKRDEKGNAYIDAANMHIPLKKAIQTAARRFFLKIFS